MEPKPALSVLSNQPVAKINLPVGDQKPRRNSILPVSLRILKGGGEEAFSNRFTGSIHLQLVVRQLDFNKKEN